MKTKFLLSILTIFGFAALSFSQTPCSQGSIFINGEEIDAVSTENNDNYGLKLPTWLGAGSTLATGDRVFSISVIEFNKEAQPGGGNTLVFNDVLAIGSAVQTVPANKVWKIESYSKYKNPFPSGISPSSSSPICYGDNLNLTATTVSGATYSWTGPNSFTSASQNPTINGATLAEAGMYYVTASLNGCSYTDSTNVVVNALPNSAFTNSAAPTVGFPVTFTPALSGQTYAWTFASGTPPTSTAENPTSQWGTANSYNVTLNIIDGNNCSSSTTNSVTISNCQVGQPQSDFTWSAAVENSNTTFTPNDITALSYTWAFTSGTSSMTTSQIPNDVVWASPGNYNVTLLTTFVGGCYTTTKSVTVSNCATGQPESDFAWVFTNSGTAGEIFSFTPNDLSADSYSWTFDQGTTGSSTNQSPSTIWGSDGGYDVTLTTTFNGVGCFTTTKNIYVFQGVTQTFNYTGSSQSFTVPAGVTGLLFEVWGGEGGYGYVNGLTGSGGQGGHATGHISIMPSSTVNIYVGGRGDNAAAGVGGTGGFNGGGLGGSYASIYGGGGGGGASDVRIGGNSHSDRIIVAGGGGGGSYSAAAVGGDGGNLQGTDGLASSSGIVNAKSGLAGTQSAGGAGGTDTQAGSAIGSPGTYGLGGDSGIGGCSGGGGGGLYGGGGGSGCNGGGGGGGSGYIGGVMGGSMQSGIRSGDGLIMITY